MSLFGVVFVGNSYPIQDSLFLRADDTHWVLDVVSLVTPEYPVLKEIGLFLAGPNLLDPSMALGLYVSVGGREWQYRGFVSSTHPSEIMPIHWPDPTDNMPFGPGYAQIGISLEPLAEVAQKEGSKLGAKEEFAKRVALDLFNYMQSFGVAGAGDQLIVPANCLDRWFTRFSEKFRRDPDFLTRSQHKD